MMTIELKIEGMSCGHCRQAVKEALEGVEGVEAATVDLEAGTASVASRGEVSVATLIAAVEEEGFGARRA